MRTYGPIVGTRNILSYFFGSIKCCYQRIKWGFCERDTWDFHWWFLSVMPEMLEYYKKTTDCYPLPNEEMWRAIDAPLDSSNHKFIDLVEHNDGSVTESWSVIADPDGKYEREWDATLDKMIFLLREAFDPKDMPVSIYRKGSSDYNTEKELYEKTCQDEGMALFAEHLSNLWS
jgi:hypothetical protein